MKICLVSDYLPGYHSTWGGGEKATVSIARLVAEHGDKVFVVTKKPLKKVKESFEHYSLRTFEDYLGKKLGLYFTRLKSIWFPFDLFTYFSALKLFKRLKPDIVNLQNFRELSFSVLLAAKKLNIPVVYSVYDYWLFCPKIDLATSNSICHDSSNCSQCISSERFGFFKRLLVPLRKTIFSKMMKKFDNVIVLSGNSKQLVIHEGVRKNKVKVVPLPFSDLKVNVKKKIDHNLILFLGWIHHRKGLKVLVQAVAKVARKHPKLKLTAIGTPADKYYEDEIKKYIKSNKLGKNINFIIGKQPFKTILELVAKAGMIVIPEQWENMSPVFLIESMFNAKPIIASRVGGIPSFIKHGESGLLARHDSVSDFAKHIEYFINNPVKARKLGVNARKNALKIFNKKKVYFELMSLYESLRKQ